MSELKLDRRSFIKSATTAAAASPLQQILAQPSPKQTIGIQVGAASFVDEGVDRVLDILRERAAVNTLFLAVFSYGRGIAGRQMPGQPFTDHGKQEADVNFRGGNYATVHPQYYKETALKPEDTRAPDHGDLDLIAAVLPAARKRGIRTILWAEDVFRTDIPNIDRLQEIDLHGRKSQFLCFNNPNFTNFLMGLFEDYLRSYEVDGIMWSCERAGALNNAVWPEFRLGGDPGKVCCFCAFCRQKARRLGIDAERARQGFLALEEFSRAARSGKRPVDGHYVTFWRILLCYPEILAWETLWNDSLRQTYAALYEKVKSINPNLLCGWHIMHTNSFSPLYRAEQDLKELSRYSDFIKAVAYHNCGGRRLAEYVQQVSRAVYADFPPEDLLQFEYRVLNYEEKKYSQISGAGLSADYVYRETRRAVEGVAGTRTLIWPGIDIDIPTGPGHSKCTRAGTKEVVLAAFRGGAQGVVLSRKYSEMKLENLSGAGDAVRALRTA